MRKQKPTLLALLVLIFASCQKSQVKIETTTMVNQLFFQEQLAKSINACQIKNDTVLVKSIDGRLSNIRFIEKPAAVRFKLAKKDTLFVKPGNNFSVYFVLKDIQSGQLVFDYNSQFNSNTFRMKKKIIDSGEMTYSCEF